jgi:hypothetical protein
MTMLTSHVVADFEYVAIDKRLRCPSCGAPYSPHALQTDGQSVSLRCTRCHVDALAAELTPNDEDEEDDDD